MTYDVPEENIEIISEFVIEARDLHENVEPTIIELSNSHCKVNCWELLECTQKDCPVYGEISEKPCWMRAGPFENALNVCGFSSSRQDCLDCKVFQSINGNPDPLNTIFRFLHTIKGSAGFLELNNLAKVAHASEHLLDMVRTGQAVLKVPDHITLICKVSDFIKITLDQLEQLYHDKGLEEQADELSIELHNASEIATKEAQQDNIIEKTETEIQKSEEALNEDENEEEIDEESEMDLKLSPELIECFVQEADELLQEMEQTLLKWNESPDDLEIVADLFRRIHSLKGNCGFYGYAHLEKLSHHIETLLDAVKSGTKLDSDRLVDTLLRMKDVIAESVGDIAEGGNGEITDLTIYLELLEKLLPKGWKAERDEKIPPRIGNILVEKGVISNSDVDAVIKDQNKPFGEKLVDMGLASADDVDTALKKQGEVKEKVRQVKKEQIQKDEKVKAQNTVKRQNIRVDLDKLDILINLIGEMAIAENMLVNNPELAGIPLENFNKTAQQMNKIVRELQEMAMTIRMIPVSGLFRRMIRLVHDLSHKCGKKVDFVLTGEETEVDKTVIETITDPLVHIIRNSLDHGIETPDERMSVEKSPTGSLKLSARNEEGYVWITVKDDGRGLNRKKILNKAKANGLIEDDGESLSDKEVFEMIFKPGFSTADQITDVSGRGVGMDVVKKNLEKVKGRVDIRSSWGKGATISLRIPLTLAIINGMIVKIDGSIYIIPVLSIRESFVPDEDTLTITPDGAEFVRIRGLFLSVIRLNEFYDGQSSQERRKLSEGILVVLETQGFHVCLFVDELLGQQQIVIKGLSNYIDDVRGVSGCTILGNGEVCLIIDVTSLMDAIKSKRVA